MKAHKKLFIVISMNGGTVSMQQNNSTLISSPKLSKITTLSVWKSCLLIFSDLSFEFFEAAGFWFTYLYVLVLTWIVHMHTYSLLLLNMKVYRFVKRQLYTKLLHVLCKCFDVLFVQISEYWKKLPNLSSCIVMYNKVVHNLTSI